MNLCRVVGYNVRGYRTSLGLSQMALEEKAEVGRTYVGQVERAEKAIGVENLGKIARALGVPPAALVTEGNMVRRGREEQARKMAEKVLARQTRTRTSTDNHGRTRTGEGAE